MPLALPVPSWNVIGVVSEARPLKADKGKGDIFAYVAKVMAIGGMYELKTRDEGLFKQLGVGLQVVCQGTFDFYNGIPQFIVTQVKTAQ